MEFSLKEAFGIMVAIVCVVIVIIALYNFGLFEGIGEFIEGVI